MSQEKVARLAGLQRNQVVQAETEGRGLQGLIMRDGLARAYGVHGPVLSLYLEGKLTLAELEPAGAVAWASFALEAIDDLVQRHNWTERDAARTIGAIAFERRAEMLRANDYVKAALKRSGRAIDHEVNEDVPSGKPVGVPQQKQPRRKGNVARGS